MRAVLLSPKFSFGQDGAHSGERAACCDPPVFAAPCGKISSLQVASAASIFVYHILSRRRKRRERRWWQTEFYIKRSVYSGTGWLADLKCQEFSGKHKEFTRMSPAEIELLMNIASPKIVKRDSRFPAAVPVQERLAITLGFWGTGDWCIVCSVFSQFLNTQSVRLYPKSDKLLLKP